MKRDVGTMLQQVSGKSEDKIIFEMRRISEPHLTSIRILLARAVMTRNNFLPVISSAVLHTTTAKHALKLHFMYKAKKLHSRFKIKQ
jgi:hypothetical protein